MKDSVKTFLIIALAFYTMMLTAVTTNAQDTTCVMICLDEVINFDFQTSEVLNRYDHEGELELRIEDGEVLCLHLFDNKKRFRDITTTFSDGDHMHNTFNTKDNVVFSNESWGSITIHISKARRRK
jgi:hypothetical protein|tara:strand:- start:177 stop:554 length:378 start_codon:yes stop_codon:yes gene_type:complete